MSAKGKGSILDYDLIEAHVQDISKEFDFDEPKHAKEYLALVLRHGFNLDDFDIQETIIDGSNDCGIDGIYIDDSNEDEPVVHIFQSKHYLSREKFDRNLEADALTKMESAIDNFILRPNFNQPYQNVRLNSKLQDIHALRKQKYRIVFTSNSNHPIASAKTRFAEYIARVNNSQDYFDVEYITLAEVASLLAPEKRQVVNGELELTGEFIDWPKGSIRTIVGRANVKEIASLREKHGDLIFDKNVRGYLSQRNSVNQEIYKSVSDDSLSPVFFFLNNGITIICKKLKYVPREESPLVQLEDLQIVNGGQTTNAIFDAYLKGTLGQSGYVLVRIVETDDSSLLDRITASTNNQTIVRARDLKSNDPIQKKIESWFLTQGLYYEARKNKFLGRQPAHLRVDAEKAAQTYFAFYKQSPADAKNKKRLLFGTYYSEIFNDSLDFKALKFSYRLYKKIFTLNKTYKETYSFVNDGDLHILALLKCAGVNTNSDLDEPAFVAIYEKVLNATKDVVDEERLALGDAYSHRAFFIKLDSLGRIEETLLKKS